VDHDIGSLRPALNQLATQVAIAIQQSELYQHLLQLATLDSLTQIANRADLMNTLTKSGGGHGRERLCL